MNYLVALNKLLNPWTSVALSDTRVIELGTPQFPSIIKMAQVCGSCTIKVSTITIDAYCLTTI